MILERILLVKFIPFMANDITSFDYTIGESIQIVLGTNGCGKSKLFSELSPLPADTKMFTSGGKKVIYINHDGKQYRLSSMSMESKWIHSFYCITDDKEYNDGGTLRIQEALVETIFKYTRIVHRILTGKLKFTTLPLQTRKDIIIMVSGLDLDYAMKLADAAHRGHRDAVGAYKHIKSKVSTLSLSSSTDERVGTLQNGWSAINNTYMELKAFCSSLEHLSQGNDIAEMERSCDVLISNISKQYAKLKEIVPSIKSVTDITGKHDKDIALVTPLMADINIELGSDMNKASSLAKKIECLEEMKHKLEGVSLEGDITLFEDKVKHLKLAKKTIEDKLSETKRLTTEQSLSKLEDAVVTMYSIKEEYELPKKPMTREHYNKVIDDANQATSRLCRLSTMLDNERAILHSKRMAYESSVKCTECGHVNTHDETCTEDSIAKQVKLVNDIEAESDKLNKEIEDTLNPEALKAKKYGCAMAEISNVFSSYSLGQLKEAMGLTNSDIAEKPDMVIGALQKERVILELSLKYKDITDQLEKLEFYMELSNKGEIIQDDTLHGKLGDLNESIESLNKTKQQYALYLELLASLEKDIEMLNAIAYKLYEVKINNCLVEVGNHTNKEVSDLEYRLMSIASELNNCKRDRALLKEAQSDIHELDVKLSALGVLSKALDHKTGIIADALRAVLESFCSDINDYIDKIWDHELTVLPYQSDTLLNFKFPFKVKALDVPDISEGSEGQHDIINFAVRLCLMDYLDITDYPIFMDEVGATFDSVHSEKLLSFTVSMVNEGKGSQLFIISHYASEYGAHSNADFVVINEDNVVVPSVYNKNVNIE